jgi:hypothetical protein
VAAVIKPADLPKAPAADVLVKYIDACRLKHGHCALPDTRPGPK